MHSMGRVFFGLILVAALAFAVPAVHADDDAEEQTETPPAEADDDGGKEGAWEKQPSTSLGTMVVTAERASVPEGKSSRAGGVVTEQDIHNGIMRTTPEALRWQTGVLVQRTNLGGGSPFIRGLTGNQVLFLVDGIRLNNATFRGGPNQYLNTIDPLFIDRIEVVRGVSSVLYGSDALGGVVNVITKRRTEYDGPFGIGAHLIGRASTADREETGHAGLEFNASRYLGFSGAWTYRSFGDVDGGGDVGIQEPYGYDVQDFGANLDIRIDAKNTIQFGYQHDNAFDVPGFDPVNPVNEFDPQRRDLYYVKYVAQGLHDAVDGIEATFSVHQQIEGRNKVSASATEFLKQDRDEVLTYHGGLKIESRIGRWARLVWGGEYYRDEIDSQRHELDLVTGEKVEKTPQFADDSLFQSYAGYLEVQITPADWVRIVPGVRYSYFDVTAGLSDPTLGDLEFDSTFSDFTWAGHVVFSPSDEHHIVLGAARGFRVPSIDDMTKLGSEDGRFDIPNDDLDPETAITYEGGYRARHRYVHLSAFGYYTDLADLIVREPATFGGDAMIGTDEVNQNKNVGDAYIWGVEGDLALMLPPNWTLYGNMTYTFGENETDDEPLRRMPPLMGTAYLRYESDDKKVFVQPYILWAADQERLSDGDKKDVRIPDGGTDGFVTYNVALGLKFTDFVAVRLIGENLSDEKYKYHGSGLWEAGRNFKGELEIGFGM